MADAAAPAVRARAVAPDLGAVGVGVGSAVGIGALAAADGGYFPTAWGWTALVTLWLVAAWLVLGRAEVNGGRLGGLFVGAVTALAGWTWLSLAWSENTTQTALEGFRLLGYVGIAAALVLVVRAERMPALLRGVLAALALISIYGLATRLFPDRLGTYDPVAGYRLSDPVGYWNGLGIFAAMGALLALVVFARDRSLVARCLAGASFPLLLATVYFTFSRGAWIAVGLGFLAAFALDPRRLQLVVALFAAGIAGGIAVLVCSSSDALTNRDAPLTDAVEQGQEVALLLLVLALLGAGAAAALAYAERRVEPGRTVRLAFAAVLGVVAAAAILGVFVRFGGPVRLVDRAYDAFKAAPPAASTSADLQERLFTFTGGYRVELWTEAWDDFEDHPLLGAGPGTYEDYWNQHRPIPHDVRDAHSLYLETLAELGPLGLALLLLALAVPLAAAAGARGHPLAPGAVAVFVAFLAHAGVDWDWELMGVTAPALACGVALIVLQPAAAPIIPAARLRVGATVAAVALAAVAFVGLVGSNALAASDEAAGAAAPDYAKAEREARKAKRWAPWSSEPWQRLGEAQLAAGDNAAARKSLRKAIDKEPTDWLLWFRLAEATSGDAKRQAAGEAARLNPLNFDVQTMQRQLAGG
jgi:O-Antigen ligase/Tetratricopeptide repeat